MRQFVAVIALALLAFMAAPPARAADKGKKLTPARLADINWGRRSDITCRYWPLRMHPSVKIY